MRNTRTPADNHRPTNVDKEREDPFLNFHHKRNFTLQLAMPMPGDGGHVNFPGVSGVSGNMQKSGAAVTSIDNIMCAVNLQGQSRYRMTGKFNAYCWDGQSQTNYWDGNLQFLSFARCQVSFTPGTSKTKRSEIIGYFGGDPVYSIEKVGPTQFLKVDDTPAVPDGPDSAFEVPAEFASNKGRVGWQSCSSV